MTDREILDLVRESLDGKDLDELSRMEMMRATATAFIVRAAKECDKVIAIYKELHPDGSAEAQTAVLCKSMVARLIADRAEKQR